MCIAAREKVGVGANYAAHIYRTMLAIAPSATTSPAGTASSAQCKRCSGHKVIYVDDAQTPCPDCQDLSDYDELSATATPASAAPAAGDDDHSEGGHAD